MYFNNYMAVFRSVDLIYPDGTGIRLSKVCGLCTLSILIPVLPKWIGSTDLKTTVAATVDGA